MALIPTGGGKSLLFQLPCLIESGISIVIMPLISLINDQLAQLEALGIPFYNLKGNNPDDTSGQKVRHDQFYSNLKHGIEQAKLVYVTPEKLT